ncbi:MAG: TolC family protein [Calditrichia bacterium]
MMYRLAVTCLVLGVISQLFAKTYNLESILILARQNNKQIKLAEADKQFADAQKKEAVSTALPKINVDLGYNRNIFENRFYFEVEDPETGAMTTQSFKASFKNEYTLNAALNQTLFGFGKIGNAIQAAGYFEKYTNFNYQTQWQDVITQVKKAFYSALLLKQVWNVAEQSGQNARENYENILLKFESGAVSEFELLQAESRWQNVIPEAMQARKNYELALNNLKALVDIPLREEIELTGEFESLPPMPDSLSYGIVFEQRPDYNSLLWEKKLQEKRVAVEFSNHLPTLSGNVVYTYGARSDQFQLENDNDNVIVGVSLNVPIFSGGFTTAQVQKAKVDVQRVKTRIDMANDNIRIELQNIRLRLKEAQERMQATQKSVNTARRAYEIAESRVIHGLATQLELKDSQVLLDQAQVSYYSAIYDYLEAYFDWQLATGQVDGEQPW